jgi:hypothetical protein
MLECGQNNVYIIYRKVMLIVLAVYIIIVVALFLYVRYKMSVFDSRLELLSNTIQTMAGVTRAALQNNEPEYESGSETGSDSESDSDSSASEDEVQIDYEEDQRFPTPERMTVSDDDVKRVSLPENETVDLEIKKTDDVIEVKKISEGIELKPESEKKNPLELLTLKELKDKVTELNGPKLKTKKDLIEFLQNKI